MAQKRKATTAAAQGTSKTLRLESSPFFPLVVFAVLFLAVIWLFSDFVFSEQMLYGSDTLQAGYFFRSFYVDYVREYGAVPQWNPYIFGGMPFVEAFHGDIFYPLSVLKFFGPLRRMLGWNLLLHVFLAGLFMYLAARQFKLSRIAALFSAVCYMFAGYLVSLVAPGHDGKIFVATLFPLVMLFLDRGFERKSFLNFSLLGLVIGVIILSPHPQMSYFTLWAVALYAVFKLVVLFRRKRSLGPLVRPGLLTVYAVVVGLLLSAIQFYPGYFYTSEFSPRAETKKGWQWATSWSMHEEEAFSLVIPEFSGASSRKARTVYWGKNAFKDNSETVGLVPLFLALLGACFCRRREAYFFSGLALFALFYALGGTTPLFRLFYALIPKVSSLRAPSMIMFLFSFSVALLAGMGIQFVRDAAPSSKGKTGRRFDYLLFAVPGVMLVLAFLFTVAGRGMIQAWCSLFYSEAATTMVRTGTSRFDLALMNLPAIQSGAWLGFLFAALVAVGVWTYRTGRTGTWVLLALVAIPVIAGIRFDSRFVSVIEESTYARYFAPNAMTDYFARKPGSYRVLNLLNFEGNDLPYHHIEVPVGYHGNQLRWYDNLLGDLSKSSLNKPRYLNLVGTRYLVMPADRQLPSDFLGDAPLALEADLGPVRVFRNDNALPRAYLVDRFQVFNDRQQIYPNVLDGPEDLRRVVYLEEMPDLQVASDVPGPDSAWVIDHAVDSVVVGLQCTANRILVLTDTYYDAWKVFVDGAPARLLRAYGALRAVAVPAGARQVLFKFDSSRYRTGRLVTWLTCLYLLVIIGFHAWRSRPKGTGE
ncbi:MAG TPA: hypothetical protein VMY05_07880 [Acidobacteriota bacterium]|nr:hypothetical protein [Acidobacteriota bacterium]